MTLTLLYSVLGAAIVVVVIFMLALARIGAESDRRLERMHDERRKERDPNA